VPRVKTIPEVEGKLAGCGPIPPSRSEKTSVKQAMPSDSSRFLAGVPLRLVGILLRYGHSGAMLGCPLLFRSDTARPLHNCLKAARGAGPLNQSDAGFFLRATKSLHRHNASARRAPALAALGRQHGGVSPFAFVLRSLAGRLSFKCSGADSWSFLGSAL